MGKTFDWFSHLFIITFYPFNVLRKVFQHFVSVYGNVVSVYQVFLAKHENLLVSIQGVEESYIKYLRVYDFNRLITGLHVYSSITYIDLNQQKNIACFKNYGDRRLMHDSNSTLPKMEFKTFLRLARFTF